MKSSREKFLRKLVRRLCPLTLCIAGTLGAQVDGGAVSGMVTDQAGQVVVQAQVTLFNQQAAIIQTRTTNSSGFYSFANVRSGSYTLIVSFPGFATYIKQGIRVDAGNHMGESAMLKLVESAEREGATSSAEGQAESISRALSTGPKEAAPLMDGEVVAEQSRTGPGARTNLKDAAPSPPATREQTEKQDLEIRLKNVNLQFFGKMDADGEWVHTSKPETGVASSRVRVASNASRFGARGKTQLTGNIKAVWQIATRVSLNGTETGGGGGLFTLWGNSRVGLETPLGTAFVGVWDTPYRQSYDSVDMYDGSHIGSPIALLGSIGNGISGSTALPTEQFPTAVAGARVGCTNFYRRQKNSVQYWSPRFHNLDFKVGYSADDSTAKMRGINPSLLSVSGAYTKNPLYVAFAFEQHKDMKSVSGVSQAGIDYGTRLTAGYRIRDLKLGLVAERLSYSIAGSPRNSRDALSVSGRYKKGVQSMGGAYTYAGDLSGAPDTGAQQVSLRYGYFLSESVELFAQYVSIMNQRYGTYNFGDGLDISTRPGATLTGSGFGLAFAF